MYHPPLLLCFIILHDACTYSKGSWKPMILQQGWKWNNWNMWSVSSLEIQWFIQLTLIILARAKTGHMVTSHLRNHQVSTVLTSSPTRPLSSGSLHGLPFSLHLLHTNLTTHGGTSKAAVECLAQVQVGFSTVVHSPYHSLWTNLTRASMVQHNQGSYSQNVTGKLVRPQIFVTSP